MWKLKACRHCGGDVFLDKDEYGWFENCLQCGYIRYPDTGVNAEEKIIKNAFTPASTVAGAR